jgi:hypothetical protein
MTALQATATLAGTSTLPASTRQTMQANAFLAGTGAVSAVPHGPLRVNATLAGTGTTRATPLMHMLVSARMSAGSAVLARLSLAQQITALLRASSTLTPLASPRVAPRPTTGKNIFASLLSAPVPDTDGFTLPPIAPRTQVFVGDEAVLFLSIKENPPVPVSGILFTRPDGSTFAGNANYLYVAAEFQQWNVVYNAGAGELDQFGWWLAQYESGGISPQYAFYVWETPILP